MIDESSCFHAIFQSVLTGSAAFVFEIRTIFIPTLVRHIKAFFFTLLQKRTVTHTLLSPFVETILLSSFLCPYFSLHFKERGRELNVI